VLLPEIPLWFFNVRLGSFRLMSRRMWSRDFTTERKHQPSVITYFIKFYCLIFVYIIA
jgi:hypothetical protein